MTSTTPEELWDAIAAAPVRVVVPGSADPVLSAELPADDRRGIIRLTSFNGTQIFIDFDSGQYYRAPKTTNYMLFDWQWNRASIISAVQVGASVMFSNPGGDWYRTSLVRYVDRLTEGARVAA